ncbi:hypothetical protein EJ06DRAFT_533615 [Trichodelitschia bisporula]|uniref:Uncharacterized protein n=1 Tax=Trichodelitschia bisporula TaxID=703511 RepID=A0A6G1HLF7_9PEZI|nr:hypothetical protein EJ06DRAFT_533615 [Trichodelitschia bisporula]
MRAQCLLLALGGAGVAAPSAPHALSQPLDLPQPHLLLPRSPQLSNALGSIVAGLGNFVSGVGSLLVPIPAANGAAALAPAPARPAPTTPPKGGQRASAPITTTAETVTCRAFPDTLASSPGRQTVWTTASKQTVTCWSTASLPGAQGRVQGSEVWLRTSGGCWVPEMNVQESTDWQTVLGRCETPKHWVGTLLPQYKRLDCYQCASLNCASRNLGPETLVDLACTTSGDSAGGNSTWIKSFWENCYFPAAIFEPAKYIGEYSGPRGIRLINVGTAGPKCAGR